MYESYSRVGFPKSHEWKTCSIINFNINYFLPFGLRTSPSLCSTICVFFAASPSFWSENSCQCWGWVWWWFLWCGFDFLKNEESWGRGCLWGFSRVQRRACFQGLIRYGTWEPDRFSFWLKTYCLCHLNVRKNTVIEVMGESGEKCVKEFFRSEMAFELGHEFDTEEIELMVRRELLAWVKRHGRSCGSWLYCKMWRWQ